MFTCLHVCLNNIKVIYQTDQKKKGGQRQNQSETIHANMACSIVYKYIVRRDLNEQWLLQQENGFGSFF
jgi:hypothetical protein